MVVTALGFSLAPSRGGSIGWKKSRTTQARPAAIAAWSSPMPVVGPSRHRIAAQRSGRHWGTGGHCVDTANWSLLTHGRRQGFASPRLVNPKGLSTRRASQPQGLPNPKGFPTRRASQPPPHRHLEPLPCPVLTQGRIMRRRDSVGVLSGVSALWRRAKRAVASVGDKSD
jgi:hypothetical protein